jgi:HAD superfamily hydrolase (TIGR01459 family)
MLSAPPVLAGLAEIAGAYDAVICDVWGVLHNGHDAFHAAADALARFRALRGPVVLLTNAPRLSDGVEALFDRLGLTRDFYDGIVTSGLVARQRLLALTRDGRRLPLFYLGPARDNPIFEGLAVDFVPPGKAEIALCTGLRDDETERPEEYRPLLEILRARNVPFHCANPDVVVQRGGRLIPCAGAIARLYEGMGGETVYYGKPYPAVYRAALQLVGGPSGSKRVLVIGDGLETDIAGANRCGLDALFISGGIHADELQGSGAGLAALLARAGVAACAAMASLSW